MKMLICEVDEDYLNELCEAFKQKPMGGIPKHRAWALLEGLKNGIALDGLTNGEVIQKMFPKATITQKNEYVVFLEIDRYGEPKLFDTTWWNRKWGE